MLELHRAGRLHGGARTVSGRTIAEDAERAVIVVDREVIREYGKPLKERAGFAILSGNIFDSAVMKVSVIDREFQQRSCPTRTACSRGRWWCSRGRRTTTTASRTPRSASTSAPCW
jgi:dihydroxyacid dehydratase/phosphogluconate dehydratase